MTQRCASNIIVRTQVKRSICFLDRAKQEVSPGAARDGFTAFQKTNDASPFTAFQKTNDASPFTASRKTNAIYARQGPLILFNKP
jgi:hypothetical protein